MQSRWDHRGPPFAVGDYRHNRKPTKRVLGAPPKRARPATMWTVRYRRMCSGSITPSWQSAQTLKLAWAAHPGASATART